MSDRPLRLGPDPNRTYLERWNVLHPERYGRPDSPADVDRSRQQGHANDDTAAGRNSASFLESLLSLAILILAPLAGAIATLLIYHWTTPDRLTTGWILGYVGVFLVTAWIGSMLVYALRRLLFAAVIASVTFGAGYLAWNLWLG